MERTIIGVTVYAEDGKEGVNNQLQIRMDGSDPDCPVTFYADGKAVFSMAEAEIDAFCENLKLLSL